MVFKYCTVQLSKGTKATIKQSANKELYDMTWGWGCFAPTPEHAELSVPCKHPCCWSDTVHMYTKGQTVITTGLTSCPPRLFVSLVTCSPPFKKCINKGQHTQKHTTPGWHHAPTRSDSSTPPHPAHPIRRGAAASSPSIDSNLTDPNQLIYKQASSITACLKLGHA